MRYSKSNLRLGFDDGGCYILFKRSRGRRFGRSVNFDSAFASTRSRQVEARSSVSDKNTFGIRAPCPCEFMIIGFINISRKRHYFSIHMPTVRALIFRLRPNIVQQSRIYIKIGRACDFVIPFYSAKPSRLHIVFAKRHGKNSALSCDFGHNPCLGFFSTSP